MCDIENKDPRETAMQYLINKSYRPIKIGSLYYLLNSEKEDDFLAIDKEEFTIADRLFRSKNMDQEDAYFSVMTKLISTLNYKTPEKDNER